MESGNSRSAVNVDDRIDNIYNIGKYFRLARRDLPQLVEMVPEELIIILIVETIPQFQHGRI